ncbi:uncharacterized protein LOC106661403 [Cimex lectularius]|uniref:Uncharacterized protein n=1 Tax=Cimex lectularius TaxID=79782 RepID=A0A8I6RAJ9_CIMLE|nr:uncharacterized protein LOC106661403 [Cimex lectularius]
MLLMFAVLCLALLLNPGAEANLFDRLAATGRRTTLDEPWHGRWFPEKVPDSPQNKYSKVMEERLQDMSTLDPECDDGKTNITLDWPTSYSDYICMRNEYLVPDRSAYVIIRTARIPQMYMARHACMNRTLEYNTSPPLFGPHRKVWARWGEYKYLPPQRWVHNLEHGGVVMLYHPCAQPFLVNILKTVVSSCLMRHIITPYNDLPLETPFAVLTWGKAYLTPDIDIRSIVHFIRANALKGPENVSTNGLYDYKLIKPAEIVSSPDDALLCPIIPTI